MGDLVMLGVIDLSSNRQHTDCGCICFGNVLKCVEAVAQQSLDTCSLMHIPHIMQYNAIDLFLILTCHSRKITGVMNHNNDGSVPSQKIMTMTHAPYHDPDTSKM